MVADGCMGHAADAGLGGSRLCGVSLSLLASCFSFLASLQIRIRSDGRERRKIELGGVASLFPARHDMTCTASAKLHRALAGTFVELRVVRECRVHVTAKYMYHLLLKYIYI